MPEAELSLPHKVDFKLGALRMAILVGCHDARRSGTSRDGQTIRIKKSTPVEP